MIALILGGSKAVWSELQEAEALLGGRSRIVVAANLAGIHYRGHLDGLASLHPDLIGAWHEERVDRGRNADVRLFAPSARWAPVDVVAERWPGSSGLYALQCALFEMGAATAVLCGIPMDSAGGHFTGRERWESVADYRRAFAESLPLVGGRTRALGGWCAQTFGRPTPEWLEATHTIRPLGSSSPQQARPVMHHVKNTSDTLQKFWARSETGQLTLVRLDPGKAGDFDIDAAQPKFAKGGAFNVTAARTAEPTPPAKAADKA